MSGCSRWNFTGGPPETSNLYCHPGRAGGSPAYASAARAYSCNDNHYVNSSGHVVHSPSCGEEHEKRAAECRDGSVSFSEHHRGTCSYHGGVAH